MSLFAAAEEANRRRAEPLAHRIRPRTLEEFVGQQHERLLTKVPAANSVMVSLFVNGRRVVRE